MPSLVTGGSGYLGTNLLGEMDRRGVHHVNADLVVGVDITRPTDLEDCVRDGELDAIYHLAADPDVQRSITDTLSSNRTNVDGILNVLEFAASRGTPVVFISSFAAKDVRSPYGLQKLTGEGYCKLYSELRDVRCMVLRLSNLYGGLNFYDNKESVVSIFTRQSASGGPITVFGGEQTRDFVHVRDVSRAILDCLRSPKEFEIYEICSGVGVSINELASMFASLNPGVSVVRRDYLPGEVMSSVGDYSLASEDFGYRPSVRLQDGILEVPRRGSTRKMRCPHCGSECIDRIQQWWWCPVCEIAVFGGFRE
jgi:UDP-glucose 4-epimerase